MKRRNFFGAALAAVVALMMPWKKSQGMDLAKGKDFTALVMRFEQTTETTDFFTGRRTRSGNIVLSRPFKPDDPTRSMFSLEASPGFRMDSFDIVVNGKTGKWQLKETQIYFPITS